MYAIIKTGGKQYRVAAGDVIDVELLGADKSSKVEFNDVLFYHDGNQPKVGAPSIAGCVVLGEVVDEVKGPKVIAFKYKRRKMYRRKVGHRQRYSRVKILEIAG
jgi:large subunit ribosomal protein L21